MPEPGKNESEQDFISRCMAFPDLQDKPQDQRAGECYGIWREHHKKSVIKAAAAHMDAVAAHDFGSMTEADHKCMKAAHRYHSMQLKELLQDTDGMNVSGPT